MNRTVTLIVLALAVVCGLPWLVSENGYLLRVMTLLMLFAAMAQSWNIVGGLANQISLGHAAFFGLGAYTSTILLIRVGLSPWLGVVAGMLVAAAAGALLSLPTMRLKGHYFALATLASTREVSMPVRPSTSPPPSRRQTSGTMATYAAVVANTTAKTCGPIHDVPRSLIS